jgi:hypothetical protein
VITSEALTTQFLDSVAVSCWKELGPNFMVSSRCDDLGENCQYMTLQGQQDYGKEIWTEVGGLTQLSFLRSAVCHHVWRLIPAGLSMASINIYQEDDFHDGCDRFNTIQGAF